MTPPKSLVVAVMQGGTVDDRCTAIWTDCSQSHWLALVADRPHGANVAVLCNATLLRSYRWDGSTFGDQTIGTVRSEVLGQLLVDSATHRVDVRRLPRGWQVRYPCGVLRDAWRPVPQ